MRCAKTLDLGAYLWYGIIVLAIEIAGATTTLVWCLNIIMDPVHEPLRMDPDNPGLTLVRPQPHAACKNHVMHMSYDIHKSLCNSLIILLVQLLAVLYLSEKYA